MHSPMFPNLVPHSEIGTPNLCKYLHLGRYTRGPAAMRSLLDVILRRTGIFFRANMLHVTVIVL